MEEVAGPRAGAVTLHDLAQRSPRPAVRRCLTPPTKAAPAHLEDSAGQGPHRRRPCQRGAQYGHRSPFTRLCPGFPPSRSNDIRLCPRSAAPTRGPRGGPTIPRLSFEGARTRRARRPCAPTPVILCVSSRNAEADDARGCLLPDDEPLTCRPEWPVAERCRPSALFRAETTECDDHASTNRSELDERCRAGCQPNRRSRLGRHKFFYHLQTAGGASPRATRAVHPGVAPVCPRRWGGSFPGRGCDPDRGQKGQTALPPPHERVRRERRLSAKLLVREGRGLNLPHLPPPRHGAVAMVPAARPLDTLDDLDCSLASGSADNRVALTTDAFPRITITNPPLDDPSAAPLGCCRAAPAAPSRPSTSPRPAPSARDLPSSTTPLPRAPKGPSAA